ncbi:MAG TPA: choice-of-anchor Q domain-containing protein, partial [Flavipsychrobacter sp.]|nr:choice-of-anchor Q domain-containing protein [Flavipsychrobacter sp.]
IYVDDSRSLVQITNALFVNNYGYPTNQVFGSGVFAIGGNVTVTNATFSGNSFYPVYSLFGTFSIQNSILDYTAYSYFSSLIINNTYLGYGVDGVGSAYPYYTGSNNISTFSEPSFVDTSRGNYTLLPCSATINTGNDSFNNISTDLSGKPRKYGTIDMGAFEYERPNIMPDTVYVNAAATDPYANGASWADAFSDLVIALNLACNDTIRPKQVWVAKGTYRPDTIGDRGDAFPILGSTQVYGGFAGTETLLNARDSTGKTNVTILSGDVQNDGDPTNNSYHIVFANGDSSSELNGFTITGGYGNGGSAAINTFGGGIFNADGNTLFANLIIKNNRATFGGGGFANFDGSPRLVNVKFINDTATGIGGGAIYTDGSGTFINPGLVYYTKKYAPVLINDSIVNCFHSFGGGGLAAVNGSVIADSVIFLNNTALYYGGGIMGSNASLFLTHCAFIGNTTSDLGAGASGGGIFATSVDSSKMILNDVLFAKNQSGPGGGIYLYTAATSVLNNVTFFGNINNSSDTTYGNGGNALYAVGGTMLFPASTALKVWNSIIDSVSNGNSDIGGGMSATSFRNTLFEGSFPAGATDGGGNLPHKDPLFVDTTTGDYRLQKCSPAVNAGNDTLLDTTITTDLAGQPRRYGGSIVDMGAYEYQGYVAKLPAAAITAGALAFCSGDSILLTANKDSGLHYQWQLNDTDIVGDTLSTMYVRTGGNYRVVITDISSCSGTSSEDTTIEHPLPKPVISVKLTTLSTTKYVTYQWYKDGKPISGATDSSYRYTLSGDYSVFVTDSNGCGKMSDTEDVNITGIKSLASQDVIMIYPNPVTSTFHIAAPVNVNIMISDMQGKSLLYKENETNIDISYFANGVYLLRITDTQGKLLKTEKLVKISN